MSRVVVFDEFGGPEVLRIVDEPVREPREGEVRVRIEAFAVNPLDVMMRTGTSPAPVPLPHARLGIEAAGVIDASGPGVEGPEREAPVIVTAIPDPAVRGSYAEHIIIPSNAVIARPSELDVPHAAATWVAFSTAYGALVEVARTGPGDTVLIAGASGAVGRMAMRVAVRVGAVPIAVTRSATRADELLAAGAAGVIATDREEVVGAVQRRTGGAGVDVVLDLVRGPGQQPLLAATRPGGTLVAAGYLDPRPTPEPIGSTVEVRNYRGFEQLARPEVVARMATFLAAGVGAGALDVAIDTVFALDEVVEAHRHFDSGRHGGRKIVVAPAT